MRRSQCNSAQLFSFLKCPALSFTGLALNWGNPRVQLPGGACTGEEQDVRFDAKRGNGWHSSTHHEVPSASKSLFSKAAREDIVVSTHDRGGIQMATLPFSSPQPLQIDSAQPASSAAVSVHPGTWLLGASLSRRGLERHTAALGLRQALCMVLFLAEAPQGRGSPSPL